MVRHKTYNLNANKDFVIDFQIKYKAHWPFHFKNENPDQLLIY